MRVSRCSSQVTSSSHIRVEALKLEIKLSGTFGASFVVSYLSPTYFGAGCPLGSYIDCGTGIVSLYASAPGADEWDADVTMTVNPDPPSDLTPEPGTIVLWLSGAVFCGLVVKHRRRLARS